MKTGIYAIEHTGSGRMYIGSATNFDARWRGHLCLLRKGKHHSIHLQSAWEKYGEDAFLFRKLLVCSKENLLMYEQRLIDGYRVFESKFGFNGRRNASSQLGMKHSDEARAKIKAKRATQVFSQETKDLWSKNRTGRKMPEWFGAWSSERQKGRAVSPETRKKMSDARMGTKWSLGAKESRKSAKIDQSKAGEIRAAFTKGGITQKALGALYGVDASSVSNIINGKSWA